MNSMTYLAPFAAICIGSSTVLSADPKTPTVEFSREAQGGELYLTSIAERQFQFGISTRQGERPDEVAKRLAEAANTNGIFQRFNGPLTSVAGSVAGLRGFAGEYVLGGTETGLGVLAVSPRSLSVTYLFDSDNISVDWEMPPDSDSITAIGFTNGGGGYGMLARDLRHKWFEKVSTYPFQYPIGENRGWVCSVNAYQGSIPSNAAIMRLHGNRQEEVYEIPFSSGIAPNWTSWSGEGNGVRLEYKEGRHPIAEGIAPRFQILKSTGKSNGSKAAFGVWRRFLGLKPGVSYRLGLRTAIVSLEEEPTATISVCAMPSIRDSEVPAASLTLPVEKAANGARRLFSHNAEAGSTGQWTEWKTGSKDIPDLTISEGTDSLLIWVRLDMQGKGSVSGAFDGVFLETLPAKKK